jgi:hypothetical protein
MTIPTPQFNSSRLRLTMPGLLLRVEGGAVFAAALMLYAHQGFS